MLRFYLLVIFSLHLVIYYAVKMGNWSKDESHTPEEKYALAKEVVGTVNKRGRIEVDGFGLENLPDEGGYVMYPNHQGRYDALGIITTHEKECRVVIDASRVNNPLLGNFLKLLRCKELEKDNPRQGVKLFKEVGEEITNGERYIIFPEGQHSKNRNNLQEFHTGCMSFLFKTKCPIVPVVLYDTYKPFEINSYKKVKCEVHYFKKFYEIPILIAAIIVWAFIGNTLYSHEGSQYDWGFIRGISFPALPGNWMILGVFVAFTGSCALIYLIYYLVERKLNKQSN